MAAEKHLGVDLGGTQIRAGLVESGSILQLAAGPTNSGGTADDLLQQLFTLIDQVITSDTMSIGIGVPGLVDLSSGVVHDLVFIPSWKAIPLQKIVQEKYALPVCINNDANCFALGEWIAGKGKGKESLAVITLGTGMGTGIILHNKLYSGKHCGAGEFGMIDYLDHNIEYYVSGSFFSQVYGLNGKTVYEKARNGCQSALEMYRQFGKHLGNAIKTILYALDVDTIILGGSVSVAWPFFQESMWQSIHGFAYKKTLEDLTVEVAEPGNGGIIGAASLFQDSIK